MPVAVPEEVPETVRTWQQAASTPNLLAGYAACTLLTDVKAQSVTMVDNCAAWHRSEPLAAPLRVALLLSGGVDSSLALRLLQEAGHEVTAFYLQIWFQDDFRNFWSACPWEEDLAVCEAVRRLLIGSMLTLCRCSLTLKYVQAQMLAVAPA